MVSKNQSPSPDGNKHIEKLRRRLEVWRKSRKPNSRIPNRLWDAAARMARQYGASKTANALHLDYYALKKRLDGIATKGPPPSFIELNPPVLSPIPECLVELESRSGEKMRIHWKNMALPDLSVFRRMFWETKR